MRNLYNNFTPGRLILTGLLGLLIAVTLAGCNLQQRQQSGGPPQQDNNGAPVATAQDGGSDGQATSESSDGSATTVETPSAGDPQGDEVDNLLNQLDDLNNTADQMTDEP